MAKIVLGIAASHSPMLSTPPELYAKHGERDMATRRLLGPDAEFHTYEELLKIKGAVAPEELALEKHRARDKANQRALASLEATLADASPDVMVIIGDDQEELFHEDNMPALSIYWGDSMLNIPRRWAAAADPSISASAWGYGEEERAYPVDARLGKHLIQSLIRQGFDVSHVRFLREGQGMPHAYSFIIRRVMNGKIIPIVPVFLNTFYPPNSPAVSRCYVIGKALARAIEEWDSGTRVAVAASGGLSHFVLNEQWDRELLAALPQKGGAALCRLPEERFQSGDSEGKNWIALAGAVEHLEMELIDYVPTPRSPAGTGGGWAFARWQ